MSHIKAMHQFGLNQLGILESYLLVQREPGRLCERTRGNLCDVSPVVWRVCVEYQVRVFVDNKKVGGLVQHSELCRGIVRI